MILIFAILFFFPLFFVLNGDAKSFEEYIGFLIILGVIIHFLLWNHK